MFKLKKKVLIVLSVFVLLIFSVMPSLIVFAETDINNHGLDIVIVMDDSASMQTNDPQKMVSEAYNAFLDIIPVEGSKVGAVIFSGKESAGGGPVTTLPLQTITGGNTDAIKEFGKQLTQKGVYTNIPAALEKATEMLKAENDDNKKVIIFVTDGANWLPGTGNGLNATKEILEASNKATGTQLGKVLGSDIPIYGIGIAKQAYPNFDKDYIQSIADKSEGKAYFPKTNQELADAFRSISQYTLGTTYNSEDSKKANINDKNATEVPFTVPEGVFQANVQIDQNGAIITEVINPSGKNVSKDSDKVKINGQTYSTNVTLNNPEAGDYVLKLKSSKGEQKVTVNFIFNYDIMPVLEVQEELVKLTLSSKDKALTSKESYKDVEAQLFLTDLKTGKTKTIDMKNEGASFSATPSLEKDTKYEAYAKVTTSNFTKETAKIDLNSKQTLIKTLKEKKLFWPLVIGLPLLLLLLIVGLFFLKKGKKMSGVLHIKVSSIEQPAKVSIEGKRKVTLGKLLKNTKILNKESLKPFDDIKGWETVTFSGNDGSEGIRVETNKAPLDAVLVHKLGPSQLLNGKPLEIVTHDQAHKITIKHSKF